MKRTHLGARILLPTLLVLSACSALSDGNVNSVHVLTAIPPTAGCIFAPGGATFVEGGDYDVAGNPSGFPQAFEWENTGEQLSTTVGNDPITDPSQNTFFAHQAQLTYATSGFTLPNATWDFNAAIAPGSLASTSFFTINLLPVTTQALLAQNVAVGQTATVVVSFKVAGSVAGGSVTTNTASFPLRISNSGVTAGSCGPGNGGPGRTTGVCGPGYDNFIQCTQDGGVP